MGFTSCDLRNLMFSAKLVNKYRITDDWNISVSICSQMLTYLSISKSFLLFAHPHHTGWLMTSCNQTCTINQEIRAISSS